MGMFGKAKGGMCFFHKDSFTTIEIIYTAGFSILTILYCISISLLVIFKVLKKNKTLDVDKDASCQRYSIVSLRSLICRTCLYPTSCFLCYIGFNCAEAYYLIYEEVPPPLRLWSVLGFSSRGLLHLVAFIADPGIYKALINLLCQQSNEVEQTQSQSLLSSECEFSYDLLDDPTDVNLHVKSGMIRRFQHYI
ncbi:hypothetical protein DSO57_1037855 [Entomophthora muscae]|uniref:Uncharacterized protein n=1 Tax=Entomophthora muscae TaxID=34485 RepID=A0ACC2S0T7_9FUNG|nr:hypothetical protein DSO57_1037855 [Entomophthora muscae]